MAPADSTEPSQAPTAPSPCSFPEVLALLRTQRETILANHLAGDVQLVRFERGRIEVCPRAGAPRSFAGDLSRVLQDATGERWVVTISQEAGEATLRDQARDAAEKSREKIMRDPLVRAVLETFPGARLSESREPPLPTTPSESPDPADGPAGDGGDPHAFDDGDDTP